MRMFKQLCECVSLESRYRIAYRILYRMAYSVAHRMAHRMVYRMVYRNFSNICISHLSDKYKCETIIMQRKMTIAFLLFQCLLCCVTDCIKSHLYLDANKNKRNSFKTVSTSTVCQKRSVVFTFPDIQNQSKVRANFQYGHKTRAQTENKEPHRKLGANNEVMTILNTYNYEKTTSYIIMRVK